MGKLRTLTSILSPTGGLPLVAGGRGGNGQHFVLALRPLNPYDCRFDPPEGSCTDRGRTERVVASLRSAATARSVRNRGRPAWTGSTQGTTHAQDQDQPGGCEAFSQDRVRQNQVRPRLQVAHPDQEVDQAQAWSPRPELPQGV